MYTYIIIDDEALIRRGTIKKLSQLNNRIACIGQAEDGKSGINLLKETNPDIIITDMNMPILDGIDFLQFIIDNYPHKPVIVISGYKDFEYAKKSIDANVVSYILKPFSKEEIISAVETTLTILDRNNLEISNLIKYEKEKEYIKFGYDIEMLKNLILGYKIDYSTLSSERLSLISKNNSYILFTIYSTLPLTSNSLNDFSSENGYGELGLYIPHLYCNNIGFFILFFPNNTPIQIHNNCQNIAKGIINQLSQNDLYINVGISSTKNSLDNLNLAFRESISSLNTQKVNTKNNYYIYNSNYNLPRKNIIWQKEDELLFRIECGEVNEVANLISELFNYFFNIPDCTLYDIKLYCKDLITKVKIIINRYYIGINQSNNSTSIDTLFDTIFDVKKLEKDFGLLLQNIALTIPNDNVYKDKDLVEKIKIYINNNYNKDISLEYISSLFYVNSSYCSRLFKNQAGIKFIDYVNSIRIEHAKNLLVTTDKKMHLISKSVGYDNVKYFFRVFKKFLGMTPDQYRNAYSNKKNNI